MAFELKFCGVFHYKVFFYVISDRFSLRPSKYETRIKSREHIGLSTSSIVEVFLFHWVLGMTGQAG